MLNKLLKDINNRDYVLIHNGKEIDVKVKRLLGFKDYYNNLVKVSEVRQGIGYFRYNEKAFSTFGLNESVDLVWVDWDGKVINTEQSFITNKISKVIDNTKFIYILSNETIKRNSINNNDILIHEFKRKK